jgi:hypothetical protein
MEKRASYSVTINRPIIDFNFYSTGMKLHDRMDLGIRNFGFGNLRILGAWKVPDRINMMRQDGSDSVLL